MMVLASIATTSFVILFLFSLPSCLHVRTTLFSAEGVGADASSPYSSDTSSNTDSRNGYCTSTRTIHIMHATSFSPSSYIPFVFPAFAMFFHLNLMPPPTVAVTSRPTLVDAGTGRIGHALGLSLCVPSRRTWCRLSRLSYLDDEESMSEKLDNQDSLHGSNRYMLQSWWWCCVASAGPGLGRHSHSLALLRLTPGADAYRFGAASTGLFSPLAWSPPVYLVVYYLYRLQMYRSSSCSYTTTNRYARLLPFPPALRNLKSEGDE
jgi:hypothetical protein